MRIIITLILVLIPNIVLAMPVVLDYVPSYFWYHGCSPTAAASILGYWDLHGYDNLFDASGWDDVRSTENVKDHISSPQHNAKYDPKPDNPDLPTPPDTSIADFMHTSEGWLHMGWTYIGNIDDSLREYPNYRGYSFAAELVSGIWENYIAEIDAGNPMLINVDSNGDGTVDHSMSGIGYEDRGGAGLWYASYNTWHESETIHWYPFRPRSSEYSFGLDSMIYIHPLDNPTGGLPVSFVDFSIPEPTSIPEPSIMMLIGTGLVGVVVWGSRRMLQSMLILIYQRSWY